MFADLGFERTTMRAVAARAGVDVALIYHHFGSKDALLTAALDLPNAARPLQHSLPADTAEPGTAIARTIIELWDNDPALRQQALAMVRTALSHDQAMGRLNYLHSSFVLTLVGDLVADDDRELRAALIGAHLTGLLLNRYLFQMPALATIDPTVLIHAAAPVIEHFLTGRLISAHPPEEHRRDCPAAFARDSTPDVE
jgi:AcrR family transcriptional regulator